MGLICVAFFPPFSAVYKARIYRSVLPQAPASFLFLFSSNFLAGRETYHSFYPSCPSPVEISIFLPPPCSFFCPLCSHPGRARERLLSRRAGVPAARPLDPLLQCWAWSNDFTMDIFSSFFFYVAPSSQEYAIFPILKIYFLHSFLELGSVS